MKLSAPKLILDAQAQLGEGPSWDAALQRLMWVDIYAGRLHSYDPESGQDEFLELGLPLGCAVPANNGTVMVGLKDGLARLDLAAAQLTWIARPESHLPHNRFNDGKCGPDGRFIVGSMDNNEKEATGALYSLSPDGALKTLLTGVRISNGLTWSPDYKTLYYIDTPTRKVMAYDYDLATGDIANGRVVVIFPTGIGWPDGMTSDRQGRLWVALWGGSALTVWDPSSGQLIQRIPIPVRNVTACAFGGPNLTDLYITSARKGATPAQLARHPKTGGLFRIQTDVEGMETFKFG